MTDTIRRERDGSVLVALESTEGFPAADLVHKKLGTSALRIAPAELLDRAPLEGDLLLACRARSAAARAAGRALGTRLPALPPSGYRIECVAHRAGRALVIIGGDLFGMLAGLSDALLHSDLTRRGLVYRGGTKTEKPSFPLRYYWTWDHSTNWVLDDPGNQVAGCANQYLKKPETYVEDYRRLVDHCLDMRFNGIVVWGFLRDAHGGERHAYQIAKYAADRGVALMPGGGTTGYGGVYYEGRHPCNLEAYLAAHPKRGNMRKDGTTSRRQLSPYHPENQEWIAHALAWLYRSFPIGGINLENSDLLVDYSTLGKRERRKINSGEADFFKDQYVAYKTALQTIHKLAPNAWNTYATYSGFGRGGDVSNAGADVGAEPYFAGRMPKSAIAQWTLTGMLSQTPAPLCDWMRSGKPARVYQNPRWPRGLEPPTPRSAGFIHQASQWSHVRRDRLALSTFAEACLRGHESGLEGISIHGEVSSRTLAWLLNYLAMRHWTYHPVSTLEDFALAELKPRLGSDSAARHFVQALCLLEEGRAEKVHKITAKHVGRHFPWNSAARGDFEKCRPWLGLAEWAYAAQSPTRLRGFNNIL